MRYSIVLALVLATGCVTRMQAASSHSVLGSERSQVSVMLASKPAALDMARLFTQRGYVLVEHRQDERGMTLKFKGDRTVVVQPVVDGLDALIAVGDALDAYDRAKQGRRARDYHRETRYEHVTVGSVFYVRVEPRGETVTSIRAIGRPMKDGLEACTSDPELATPCEPLYGGEPYWREIGGFAEAEVIEGVFAELRLTANVISRDPAIAIADGKCMARRRELQELAGRVSDPRARAGILGSAPSCGAALTAKR